MKYYFLKLCPGEKAAVFDLLRCRFWLLFHQLPLHPRPSPVPALSLHNTQLTTMRSPPVMNCLPMPPPLTDFAHRSMPAFGPSSALIPVARSFYAYEEITAVNLLVGAVTNNAGNGGPPKHGLFWPPLILTQEVPCPWWRRLPAPAPRSPSLQALLLARTAFCQQSPVEPSAMAHQKTNILERLRQGSPQECEQHNALVKLAAWEDLNEWFERVSKGPQSTALYAKTTEYHINCMERMWSKYVPSPSDSDCQLRFFP